VTNKKTLKNGDWQRASQRCLSPLFHLCRHSLFYFPVIPSFSLIVAKVALATND